MHKVLLRHADVITLDAENRVLFDADVAIEGGTIVAVGAKPVDFEADETVDVGRRLVLPGFFNAHTHSATCLLRGWVRESAVERWISDPAWLANCAPTPDDVYWGSSLAAVEMIRSGTVGFADHYVHMDRVAEMVDECGLRANLAWCTFGSEEGEIGTDLPGVAAFTERWQDAGEGRIHTMLGPYSPELCTPEFLARSAAVAARLGVGIHIHVADLQQHVDESLARYDLTPVELLDRNGVLDVQVLAVHAAHLDESDCEILASKGTTVVHCPTVEMRLATGATPVAALHRSGVRVALGTGSPAWSEALSMLQEARLVALWQRHAERDPRALPADLVLRMITQSGADALGFPLSGEIAPRRNADLVVFDVAPSRSYVRNDPLSGVLFGCEGADVRDVMVAGRWLMRKRELLTLDEERIAFEAGARATRLAGGQGRSIDAA